MTEQRPQITGLIITLNEEQNIAEVIKNIDFVDEIIVLDSFSTDKTVEIAESFENVKVYQNKFENFTDQRNLALDYASYNWILFLDADERLTPKLREEIFKTINQNNAAEAYYFYRKFMFKDKPLHFSGWQTDKNIRLFKKDSARYSKERLVHEILRVKGRTRVMKHKLIHYSYLDYNSYKDKMEKYAKLKAKELYMKEVKPNFFHYYIKPAYKFFYKYIVRLGILDGKKGFTICYLNAYSVYSRYPYLKKLYKKNKKVV
jgi:glycosyltransferase involved in cell wall biosynthesis